MAAKYACWYDFFSVNRIKINVGTNNTNICQALAMDAIGGLTVSYQYSASSLLAGTNLRGVGENIQFVFSSLFPHMWGDMGVKPDVFIDTGYIHDNAIALLSKHEKIARLREELMVSGADYILSFFDENSSDRWDIYASDEDCTLDYEFLLKWLIEDQTLGMIFKPKRSGTLFKRISRISELVKQAEQTGRCRFLMSDTLYGNVFPAEAAISSDLCIGKLSGATAGFEAVLAGIPTVLIDLDGFKNHPFYSWGEDSVVFDDWNILRERVEEYRNTPELLPQFGNWAPALHDLDPYLDGNAGKRMEDFIAWIHESFKCNHTREEALLYACEQFRKKWGANYITSSIPGEVPAN